MSEQPSPISADIALTLREVLATIAPLVSAVANHSDSALQGQARFVASELEKAASNLRRAALAERDDSAPSERETALVEAAQEFIDKCDRGEVRSVRSYATFKAALAKGGGDG